MRIKVNGQCLDITEIEVPVGKVHYLIPDGFGGSYRVYRLEDVADAVADVNGVIV